MPRLLSTLICEDLLTNPDGALSLYRAVFKRQTSARFPAQLRCLYVVTIWLGDDRTVGEEVDQRVLILSPGKTTALYDCFGKVRLAGEQQVSFANRFQWIVWPTPGVYWVRVLNGTQPIGEDVPVVIEQEPPVTGGQP